ncbi:hypothetical protein [Thiocapsa rosea]|uniref:Fido domain-containing protein n=1 Tax=Thiocapsa rosea TaxID=69360 RepID=A0A495VB83_9GAMM|nr:hypothetical protein [Thiocapsa rosea]RKT46534.1 hypothetical protein BDD21_4050 [Thiocapsa rosea]
MDPSRTQAARTGAADRSHPRDPGSHPMRLNLTAIDASLRAVQDDFDRINRTLSTPRDPMTDMVRRNMMAGYRMVDEALRSGLDPFERGHSKWLLELNTCVLCGEDVERRREFSVHIAATEQHFYEQQNAGIGGLMDWLAYHRAETVWFRAAGVYVYVLSRPQLYIEGNHRTGSLIMSYLLAREGKPPFVLSVANAKAYFDPSTLVKDARKHSLGMLITMPKLKKRLARLLKGNGAPEYLVPAA